MTLCTAAFVSKVDPDQAYREELRDAPGMSLVTWALSYQVDRNRREASTAIAGAAATRAVYREGAGCVLAFGAVPPIAWQRPSEAAAQPDPYPALAQAGPVAPADARIEEALAEAFAESKGSRPRNTKVVVIVHRGQLLGERYAPGVGPDTPLPGHSLSKSMIHALVGVLSRRGALQPDAPVPLAEWKNASDSRRTVTPIQLLAMDSGLPWDEYKGGFDPSTRMWFDEPDPYDYAQRMALDHPPGTHWAYSNLGYIVLSRMLRDSAGGKAAGVLGMVQQELLGPLRMQHTVIGIDLTGTPMGANGVIASARDWARLGLLYLNNGRIGERQILPAGWVEAARMPTLDAGYGRGFWLNNTHAPHPLPGQWGMPEAPADAYFGRGYLGQFIVIVPSLDLLVVRLGTSFRRGGDIATVGHLVAKIAEILTGRAAVAESGALRDGRS